MQIALISIGHCPSLATRNLKRYCLAHEDLRDRVEFSLFDHDIRGFLRSRVNSTQRWSFATSADEILSRLLEQRPAIVGFSCYLWNSEISIQLASQIKQLLPDTQIVLGGPDVGPRATVLLEHYPALDVIVEGDGEVPFLALVRQHLSGEPWSLSNVPRANYRSGGCVVRSNAPAGPLDPLLLRDVYSAAPTRAEVQAWGWPYVLYETMRGCPYQCSYCMYSKIPANEKDVAIVIEELAALLKSGVTVELIDPTFTTYAKRAKAILRGLTEHEYDGRLWFDAYPDSIDEEMVALCKRANVSCVGLGFQTLSEDGLKTVGRPKNLARFERAVRLLHDAQIRFYVDVIYGLPNTTADDFVATLDYLHELDIVSIVAYRLLGLPGSSMLQDIDRYTLVFSQTPPYELLSSHSFSLDDILFCERFRETYHQLQERLGDELLRRFSRIAGKLSSLVRLVMESRALQQGDVDRLNQILADLMRRTAAKPPLNQGNLSRTPSAEHADGRFAATAAARHGDEDGLATVHRLHVIHQ